MDWSSLWPSIWGIIMYAGRVSYGFPDRSEPLATQTAIRQIGADLSFMGIAIWGIVLGKTDPQNWFCSVAGPGPLPRIAIGAILGILIVYIARKKKKEDTICEQIILLPPREVLKPRKVWAIVIHLAGIFLFFSATMAIRTIIHK